MLFYVGDSEIRKRLSEYTPGSTQNLQGHGYSRVCVQLFGMTGHGKSSLINSCLCVAKDVKYRNVANSSIANTATTMMRNEFKLNNAVYMTDNRGITKLTEEELFEISAQFCQLRTTGEVMWKDGSKRNNEALIKTPKIQEIIVPVFVYSAEYPSAPQTFEQYEAFIREAYNMTDLFPIIVLTKCKQINTKELEYKFRQLGANHVVRIENYTTTNNQRNPEIDTNILKFLEICLEEADQAIDLKLGRDPQQEWSNKVSRLNNMIKEAEERKQKQEKEDEKKRYQSTCILI
ncbi:uncharacterized protein LOC134571352 [Pelobates fuscus]|uniref:uncharacterized protein LOC134571352 n=1 Tax=Pelobates fuscus TaxID=191477 RepID=UPI002FE466F0